MTDPGLAIRRAAVIGAGTMGAGIAALLARAGVRVDLLDIVPDALTSQERSDGLELSDPRVRNRIARDGWARSRRAGPVSQIAPEAVQRVSLGNLEDDFSRLEEVDWIVEAVIEDLDVKRQVMARIEQMQSHQGVVSTNTSGLPLHRILDGRGDGFQRRFLGTHFFNPPLVMKLVELIPGPQTDPTLVQSMKTFIERSLGKGVVTCKDTPNFIANRVASVQSSYDMNYALTHGYTVEEVDAILGPIVGRPRTAVFRLRDLVGLDVSTRVAENLYLAIPHDPFRRTLMLPALDAMRKGMLARGLLGRKTGGGFYRAVDTAQGRRFLPLDLEKLVYVDPQTVEHPTLARAGEIDDLAKRLQFLVTEKDRVGELVWASLSNVMAYAAACLPEIADELYPIDRALRWGYSWEMGPFEIWDAIGVPGTLDRMTQDGLHVAEWVRQMVRAGNARFYESFDGLKHVYSPTRKAYLPLEDND